MSPYDFYHHRKLLFEKNFQALQRKLLILSVLRILTILLSISFFILAIRQNSLVLSIAAGLSFIVFIILVVRFKRLQFKKALTKALIEINKKEIEGLNGDFSHFSSGKEYLNPEHEFTYDLDIFGQGSLFQYINRTCTIEGEKKLAKIMLSSPIGAELIKQQQIVLKELSSFPEFIQDFISAGTLTEDNENDKKVISEWINSAKIRNSLFLKIYIFLVPFLNLTILASSFFSSAYLSFLSISVVITFLVYSFHIKMINKYHVRISKRQEVLKKYLQLNKIILKQNFAHTKLKSLQNNSRKSLLEIRNLTRLINFLDTRLNMLVGFILNALFLFDFHIIRKLERWKKQNSELLSGFFETTAEFDAINSMAVYCFNHREFAWPEIDKYITNAVELGHPLLHSSKRVCSDLRISSEEKVLIITGANMAGKSTFLRAVGVNMLMAGIGLPVCAKKMKFSPVKLMTGMRTTDSLAESESYFFAELKRLKRIIEALENNEAILVLLDEILKGTNSSDKHKGSLALIKQLLKYKGNTIIATHDLELGDTEKYYPGKVRNYSFESYIRDGELYFDYKLKKGLAKNMNASFLMEKMGII
jgi:DNA mismatch repair ATPase MutS